MIERIEAMNTQINDLKRALDVMTERNAQLMFERDQIASRRAEVVELYETLRGEIQNNLRLENAFLRERSDYWHEQTKNLQRQLSGLTAE